jgi:hypothetical protein
MFTDIMLPLLSLHALGPEAPFNSRLGGCMHAACCSGCWGTEVTACLSQVQHVTVHDMLASSLPATLSILLIPDADCCVASLPQLSAQQNIRALHATQPCHCLLPAGMYPCNYEYLLRL